MKASNVAVLFMQLFFNYLVNYSWLQKSRRVRDATSEEYAHTVRTPPDFCNRAYFVLVLCPSHTCKKWNILWAEGPVILQFGHVHGQLQTAWTWTTCIHITQSVSWGLLTRRVPHMRCISVCTVPHMCSRSSCILPHISLPARGFKCCAKTPPHWGV